MAPSPDVASPGERRSFVVSRALLTALVAASFGRMVSASPASLERGWLDVASNPTLRPSADALAAMWRARPAGVPQPVGLLSFWLDTPWLGASSVVVHATNLVLLGVSVWLLAAALERVGLRRATATLGASLLACHPALVECVGTAGGRPTLTALVLALLGWNALLRSAAPLDRLALVGNAALVAASFASPLVAAVPFALALADVVRDRDVRVAGLRFGPSLLGGALIVGLAGRAPTSVTASFVHFVEVALAPLHPSPAYAEAPAASWVVVLLAASLVVALVGGWRARATLPRAVVLGVALFVISIGVAVLTPSGRGSWADGHAVVAVLALGVILGGLVEHVTASNASNAAQAQRVAMIAGALVCAPLVARSVTYASVWSSDVTLWSYAVETEPRAPIAWIQLGAARRDAQQLDRALDAYAQAIEFAPEFGAAHASFLYVLGLRDERSLHLEPTRALMLSEAFLASLNDAPSLRALASRMREFGYRDAMTFVLGRSLDLEPIRDDQLEHAIAVQLREGNTWLARFYLSRMRSRPLSPLVTSFYDDEARAAGVPTLDEQSTAATDHSPR